MLFVLANSCPIIVWGFWFFGFTLLAFLFSLKRIHKPMFNNSRAKLADTVEIANLSLSKQ
jgi:hypothetical protein